MKHNREVL